MNSVESKSTNPWNGISNSNNGAASSTSNNTTTTTTTQQQQGSNNINKAKPTSKTPDSFLGENSSLVNLDNLIPSSSSGNALNSNRSKSTNPFGGGGTNNGNASPAMQSIPFSSMSSTMSTSTGYLNGNQLAPSPINNPFLVQQQINNQKQPTISQLQQQQHPTSFTTNNNNNNMFQPFNSSTMQPFPSTNINNNGFLNQFNSPQQQQQQQQQPPVAQQSTNPFLMM
jgi:hypothetical protein